MFARITKLSNTHTVALFTYIVLGGVISLLIFLIIKYKNKMTEQDEKQLKNEIAHIFESGANEIRVFEMVKYFINSRRDIYKSEFIAEIQDSYAKEHLRYQIIHKRSGLSYNSKLYMSKDNADLDCPNEDYVVSVLFLK